MSESGAVRGRVHLKLSWQPDTFHDFLQRLPQEEERYTVDTSFILVYILRDQLIFNSIQVYLYSAFYDTIVTRQLYRKLSFHNIFIIIIIIYLYFKYFIFL